MNGAKSVVVGGMIGVASFISVPVVAVQNQGWWPGLLTGGLAGSIFGAIMTVVGIGNAVFHVCVGTIKTPSYLQAVRLGKIWDDETETWVYYYMEKEQAELASTERQGSKSVADMELYDLLDVPSSATTKEIKRAYFGKAKIWHPDKNPNDPEAADKFRALHGAYQTLSDADKRATYDKYGMSDDSSARGDSPMAMDAHVFFAVLFGSQSVEPYIGELSVSSWTDQMLKMAQAGFTPTTLKQLLDDGLAADRKRRKRQLDIAIHLLSRIDAYVTGKESKEVFRAGCRSEAAMIVETTPFGDVFLKYIGAALKLQGGRYLGLHKSLLGWKVPFYVMNRKIREMSASVTSVRKTLNVAWIAYTTLQENNNATSTDEKNANKESKEPQEMMEILLPVILDMAWAYNVQDIGTTLQGACWRLLVDADDTITKADRIKRAKAIQIIGDEFASMGKSSIKEKEKEKKAEACKDTTKTDEATCTNPDQEEMDLISRLEVAYGVAQLKASGQSMPEDSEALIQKRTSEALAMKRSDEAAARRAAKRKEKRRAKQAKNSA
jgi:hypothetical protein